MPEEKVVRVRLEDKVDALEVKMDQRFDALRGEIHQRFGELRTSIDKQFESVNHRFALFQWALILIFPFLIAILGKLFLLK